MTLRKLLIAAMGVAVVAGGATTASANTPWQNHHPRRVEVNHRLTNLNRSIREERREGELTRGEAAHMHARVHHIRMQERRMARFHGGHLTRVEQARLNHEETGVRRHIPG
ncbi:MAG: hypothetical protein JO127_05660 [Caulobacteraceae bacterium]|nr:hypothetical protein [Caulobacteraceae bacterium]